MTSRADFEQLIELRLREARLLLADGDWNGAYYVAGYAVEFAFKIVIIAGVMKADGFPDRKLVDSFYRHDLAVLRRAADLDRLMDQDAAVEPAWVTVARWSEQSRYELNKTEQQARGLYDGIENGVLPWIKGHW